MVRKILPPEFNIAVSEELRQMTKDFLGVFRRDYHHKQDAEYLRVVVALEQVLDYGFWLEEDDYED